MLIQKLLYILTGIIALVPFTLRAQEGERTAFFWADTVTVEAQKTVRIPTLNAIGTKMLIPLHSTPASVGVVTRAVFETQKGVTLRDALKNISGVNVQNGSATFDLFLIRGFESLAGGLILTDGAAEPEVSFYNLYNIDRIEVLKGPSAFLYGGNPLSGAVNLIRKQPVFSNFANFSGSYGAFQTYRGTFDIGMTDRTSTFAFRLNGMWQESDGFRDDKENDTYAVNPSFTWGIDSSSSITANLEYVNSDHQPEAGLPVQFTFNQFFQPVVLGLPDVPRERSYQTPIDDSDQELLRLRVDYNREFNQSFSIRNKFYFTSLDWIAKGTLLNGAFPNAQGGFDVFRTLTSLDDSQNFVGNQIEALFSFSTGTIKHNLVAGFETARLSDDFGLDVFSLSSMDLFNPVETITSFDQLTFLVQSNKGDARSLILAPYFINRVSFSKKFQLFFGGRFDVIDYNDDRTDSAFDFTTGMAEAAPSKNSRNYEKFSPMGGLVVAPTPSISFYTNVGQSFRPPSVLVIGDPKPEESTQFELGTKLRTFGGKLNSTLALYHLERDNIRIPDETGITQQTGSQRSRGIEFEIAAQPTRGWHTFFTYSYTDAELTEFRELDFGTGQILDHSGNTAVFTPEHILNVWTTKEYNMGIGIGGGLRYVSGQFIDEDNLFEIDDYLVLDATVYYTYKNLHWSLNIKNITDQNFESRAGFGASVIPADPRAISGSVEVSL